MTVLSTDQLPPTVRDPLRLFVLRWRRLAVLRAVGVGFVLFLAWILAVALVDRLLPLPGIVRLISLLVAIVAFCAAVVRPLTKLVARVAWNDAAERVELLDPTLRDRLQTVTSRRMSKSPGAGSPAMLAEVERELTEQLRHFDSAKLLPPRQAAGSWFALATLSVSMLALSVIGPLGLPQLLLRQFLPLANLAPVTTTRLTVTPGDTTVVEGEPLKFTVHADRLGDSTVVLRTSDDGRIWSSNVMTPPEKSADKPADSGDAFVYTLNAAAKDFTYTVSGGDATTQTFHVAVLKKPTVTQFRVRYTYPPYIGRQPLDVTNTDGVLEAPAGTTADVSVLSAVPLASAVVRDGKERVAKGTTATVEPSVRNFKIAIEPSRTYKVELTGENGVRNSTDEMNIRSIPDRPPALRLGDPGQDLRLSPQDVMALPYEAIDDYGVEKLEAVVRVNGRAERSIPVPMSADKRYAEDLLKIDLMDLGVSVGNVVAVSLAATDGAGQRTVTQPVRVLLSPKGIDLNAAQRVSELREAKRLIDEMLTDAERASDALNREPAEKQISEQALPRLSEMQENGPLLVRCLLRAEMHGCDPDFNGSVAHLIDNAQVASDQSEYAAAIALPETRDPTRHAVDEAKSKLNPMRDGVTAMYFGERAAEAIRIADDRDAALKQIETLRARQKAADEAKPDGKGKDAANRRDRRIRFTQGINLIQESITNAERSLHVAAKELGVDSGDANFRQRLQEKVDAGLRFARDFRGAVDFVGEARGWAGRPPDERRWLESRLAVASQAEAVRPDGDLVRARDLQLAGRAADHIDGGDIEPAQVGMSRAESAKQARPQFGDALDALRRQWEINARKDAPANEVAHAGEEAQAARTKMHKWAGDVDESQTAKNDAADQNPERAMASPTSKPSATDEALRKALEANAAMAEKKYDLADALDDKTPDTQSDSADPTTAPSNTQSAKNSPSFSKTNADRAQPNEPQDAQANDPNAQAQGNQNADDPTENDARVKAAKEAIAKSMQQARQLDKLAARQNALKGQTEKANQSNDNKPDAGNTGELAAQQQALAKEIAAADKADADPANSSGVDANKPDTNKPDASKPDADNADGPTPDADAEEHMTREQAMAAVRAAQEKLAAMPQQLNDFRGAQDRVRDAKSRADAADRDAQTAPDDQKSAMQKMATQYGAQSDERKAERDKAGEPVSPDAAGEMSATLKKASPLGDVARDAIDNKLTPALNALKQAAEADDQGAANHATDQAREAIADAQKALAEAQEELIERDPLVAAKVFSQHAADALKQSPNDLAQAMHDQAVTSQALHQAWDARVRATATARLNGIPGFDMLTRLYPFEGTGRVLAGTGAAASNAGPQTARDWGRLRSREPDDLSAPVRETDAPGYQEALRVYFQTLSKSK